MTTEQPPGAPVNPYEELTNAYYAPGRVPQAMWAPPPTRSWKGPVAVTALAVVMLGFGAAFGVNEFAKHQVCGEVAASTPAQATAGTPAVAATRATPAASTATTGAQSAEQLREDIDATRRHAALLVIDSDLRAAVNGLTDDAENALKLGEEIKTISAGQRTEYAKRLVGIVQDMDGHWRAAQRACGQAETGLLRS
ncbi:MULTISPECIES: hypothetical protein [Catenuloplanes]|uniref:DNA-binding transcriptional regulator YdaS (Cro superfamily) n=1 Tax=Catenuloplanes niger TaxID=587534 RepID=A0AAE3ZS57_9ACTN|nr:hypothetical protein [Catenuloplanes niger]MDR7323780.1 DNA-binding transcriptional regulator YdaS (Cro superfamily) [Catenuloplanes niger]